MVDPSKILTVSYGTFSCTLEGFDDSFGTMKAIAEYFRDLAADDRYFGAEPPTPDVHMLAKIAEREITRRVDARTTDGGIVLRALEAVGPAMPPQVERPDPVQVAAAAVAPQVVPTPKDHTLDDFQTALSDATADDMEPVAGPEVEDHVSSPLVASGQAASSRLTPDVVAPALTEAPAHPDAESVAAKLQRIRAVVGKAAPKVEEVDFAEDLTEEAEPLVAELPAELVADDVDDIDFDQMGFEDEDDSFEVAEEAPAADEEDDHSGVEITTDKIAAALAIADGDGDYVEDDDIDEMLAELSLGDDQLAEDIADASEAYDDADDQDDDSAEMLSNLQAKVAQAAKVEVNVEPEAKPEIRAQVVRMRREKAQPEAEAVSESKADKFEFTSEDDTFDDADYGFDDDAFEDEFEDEAEEDVANLASLDGVEEFDDIEGNNDTTLPEDEEAALLEELAEVERDFAPAAPQKSRKPLPATDDATMSHILDQTDQELNEPEGNRRRNAIAQLKAAVAATEAARQLGDKGDNDHAAEDAFRGDLNEAVRPTRPAATQDAARPARPSRPEAPATRTERPRPAPLKLVASQRVDAAKAAAPEAPVQPRRVASAAPEVTPATASNFAEFAEEMGASSLADLLEAAAAYTAFVEGSEDFSRPQIMKKVQSSTETEISREDGLRSFGTLLRQGRISKVRNGRFQVSEETRFRPESKVG